MTPILRKLVFSTVLTSLATSCARTTTGARPESAQVTAAPVTIAPAALALTPPMGFNNWNAFGCDVSESLIKETANLFVSSGLKDAGYVYVNIDDCWSLRERGPDGKLMPDPVKFPSGIRGLSDYVHGLGLKLGIYGDAGTKTCAGYPGSLGQEKLDAKTWASWGVDYVKYDNCYNQSDGSRADFVRRYTAMREAIDETGRPMVYSICEWGQSKPWEWATGVGNLWRTTGDISDSWSSLRSIIAANAPLARYAGPGHWNDPDMLEIGNGGMTPTEYRTHMSLWSMMAAPLIIGTDLRKSSADTLAILGNRDVIAIDQDPLGKQATVVSEKAGRLVFAKPLSTGDVAVAFYNSTDEPALIDILATEAGLPRATAYRLKDLWSGRSMHSGSTFGAGVAAHGTVVYRASVLESPNGLPPSVSVTATHGPLIPSVPGGAFLNTVAMNHGVTKAAITLEVKAPSGWVVKLLDGSSSPSAELEPGLGVMVNWNLTAPADTAAGDYPLSITAKYKGAEQDVPTSVATELIVPVVVPPPDGVSHLSRLRAVVARSALGPVERDMTNGALPEGDGNLITLGGNVYTRGLGTRAPSDVYYYLGGRCSSLTTGVGIDDEATAGAASFKIFADNRVVAESGPVRAEDPPRVLKANVTGAKWLKLVTEPGDTSTGAAAPTDWAQPLLTCGKSTAPTRPELAIFSFEPGTESVTVRNAGAGGSFRASAAFHTDGKSGLEVTSPADGNWFGRSFPTPLDLTRKSELAFDVKTGAVGTVGEFAVEVGPDKKWCQGGRWAWVNPSSTKTIRVDFKEISCPAGTSLDRARITGVWVFLKNATVVIDQVRAE